MVFKFDLASDNSLLQLTTSGDSSAHDFIDCLHEMKRLIEESNVGKIIADHRNLNFNVTDTGDLSLLIAKTHEVIPVLRNRLIATVVESDLGFAFGRMWDSLGAGGEPIKHMVCRTIEEANEWLGL